jgi:hypothetical protein
MDIEASETEFIKHLHTEKLKAEEARTTYTLRKLAYATTLLGLGSLDFDLGQIIDAGNVTAAGNIHLGLLLYLAPWVALASDLYILAEDYSVKRFGAFLWKNSPDVSERGWEEWVSENRDPFGPIAMPTLTTVLLVAAALILWAGGSAAGPIFSGWLILTPLATWGLYFYYRGRRGLVRKNARTIPVADAVMDVTPAKATVEPAEAMGTREWLPFMLLIASIVCTFYWLLHRLTHQNTNSSTVTDG